MPQPPPATSEEPQPSLDDVVMLLMQLEATDVADLRFVRQALHTILLSDTENAPRHAARRSRIMTALQYLDSLTHQHPPESGRVLQEVQHLLAQLTDTREVTPLLPYDTSVLPPQAPASLSMSLPADTQPELVGDFITEGREHIMHAEAALLALESDPEDTDAVHVVFRAFHTIKGTAAFLGLSPIVELAHHAESLLSRVRTRDIPCTGGYADLALRAADMLKALLQVLQDALGGAPLALPPDFADLVQALAHPEASRISADLATASPAPPRLGDLLVAEGTVAREQVEAVVAAQGDLPLGIALLRAGTASLPDVARALRTQQRLLGGEAPAESSVRVRTDRLDRLIDMIGELVIAHAMVMQDEVVVHRDHQALLAKTTHMGKIVRSLQDLSLLMRMVPLKPTFHKMARVVRDVALKSGKSVTLLTEGDETDIDRNVVEVIADSLVHMVRNAVGHGIESPEVRESQGKPRTGIVRLRAYHAGDNVVITLHDDGQGLDRDRILQQALARGLIASTQGLSDDEVFSLILQPGFSTAAQITDISGRGVGMDVVHRSVEALKGRLEIASQPGRGTTFTVSLPLTLAVTEGMLVKVGDERYLIPIADISRSFRPRPADVSTVTGRGELVVWHDTLTPVLRLHRLLHVSGAREDPAEGMLVVVHAGARPYALLVDELLGQRQVIAKTLGPGIGHVPGISGAAILGDGRVRLILNVTELVALFQGEGYHGGARPCTRQRP